MNRFTFHFNCQNMPQEGYLRFLGGSASWVFLLDPSHDHIDAALGAGKRVVVRLFDPLGDYRGQAQWGNDYYKRRHAYEVVNHLKQFFSKYTQGQEVYFISGINEPHAGRDELLLQTQWVLEYARLALAAGFRVNLGGWNTSKSVSVSPDGRIQYPEAWTDLLRFASDHRERVMLDFHDYTTGRAWSQQHDRLDTLAARLWKPQPLRWDDEQNVNGQWHIGRHAPLIARARRLGLRPRFCIGECLHDHMDDLGPIRQQLNARFGMPEFMGDIRGTRSHYRYYAALSGQAGFGSHTLAEMLREDIAWLDAQYSEEFEVFALFAYNRNRDWIAYDFSAPEMASCFEMIRTYRSNNDMSQPNPPQVEHPEAAALDIVQTVRVREVPGTGGTILGQLAAGIRVSTRANRNTVQNQGYEWLQFEHNGRAGWVALHKTSDLEKPFVRVTWLSDEEETPEIPEVPPGMTIIDLPHFSFTAPVADLTNAAAYFAAERENPYTPAWLDQLLQVLEMALAAEAQRLQNRP